MIDIEEFRDVPGYEGTYEVSNLGRIRRNEKILRPIKNKDGYLLVNLCKNGIMRKARIHRLVAYAFIPNPQNLPCINHKDEDKTNNAVNNLEWCTYEYNTNYGTRNERAGEKISEKLSKPVLQFDLNGSIIKEWPSTIKVEEELGINQGSISHCCLGHRNSAGGFIWKYKN